MYLFTQVAFCERDQTQRHRHTKQLDHKTSYSLNDHKTSYSLNNHKTSYSLNKHKTSYSLNDHKTKDLWRKGLFHMARVCGNFVKH